MIYFAQAEGGGPIKIGYTADIQTRLSGLASYYGRPMVLLGTMRGGARREEQIHRRFAHLRLGRTEQFQPAPELLAFIGRPQLVSANPDAVEVMEPVAPIVLTIRARPEWEAWMDRLCDRLSEGATVPVKIQRTVAVDAALAALATKLGIEPPPARV